MNYKKKGFTIIELLTVISVMAILVGLLLPAINMVHKMAKEAAERAQLNTIELALLAFRNDQGYYPPSDNPGPPDGPGDYSGAQKLAEALVGLDLLGFHKDSVFRSNGWDSTNTFQLYTDDNLSISMRKGPYLELATTNVFRVGNISVDKPGLFPLSDLGRIAPDTYVLCDVFGVKKVKIPTAKTVKAGTPILYYRANASAMDIDVLTPETNRVYNVWDNLMFARIGCLNPDLRHKKVDAPGDDFYEYIKDPRISPPVTNRRRPYRPDSYLLISAGADGMYGTSDDICNF